ncbi:MAG: OmpA family protein [Rubrimonas sp.]|uniref:OmpA family protein n=1 Tax=Rubrimonas sp. TaxID=2036015 RepID=UPI002FDCEED1
MSVTRTAGAALLAALLGGAGLAQETTTEPGAGQGPREILFGFTVVPFGPEGIETVSSVARTFRRGGFGAAEVVGHADTVGGSDANLALSLRRADFTRDELVARGVPASAVAITALGETDLAEQTGDEVRRSANRRVAIAIIGEGMGAPLDETRPPAMRLPPAPAIQD